MAGVSVEEYKSFIGIRQEYYIPYFERCAALGGNFSASWNWSAFFFPYAWLFYRKMYLFGVIALAVSFIFSFIGWFVSGLVVGIAGNFWYYYHATKKIQMLRFSFPNENIEGRLALLGGTNPVVAWIVAIFYFGSLMFLAASGLALLSLAVAS